MKVCKAMAQQLSKNEAAGGDEAGLAAVGGEVEKKNEE